MKKQIILLCLLVADIYGYGQQFIDLQKGGFISGNVTTTLPQRQIIDKGDVITVNYTYPYLRVTKDTLYSETSCISMMGLGHNHITAEPDYLFHWDSFSIPSGKDITVSLVDSSYIEIPISLSPARPLLSMSDRAILSKESVPPISPYVGYFPNSIVAQPVVSKYRSNEIADICIRPTCYNMEKHVLRVYKSLTYQISFEEKPRSNTPTPSGGRIVLDDSFLQNTTLNGLLPNPIRNTEQVETTKDYLIISTPEYEDEIQSFAHWKRTMGFNVIVLIRSTWSSDEVKEEIASAYDNANALYYVLLVGNNVPSEFYTCQVYDCNTDFFYGCIGNDYIQDVEIGRITADTPEEAQVIFNKIISYEESPIQDESFYMTGTHVGSFWSADGIHTMLNSSMPKLPEDIKIYMNSLGRDVSRVYYAKPQYNPTYWGDSILIPNELRKPNFAWDGNADSLVYYVNEGALYVLASCHGAERYWSEPDFYRNNVQQLANGNKLPVLFSMSCHTGQYWRENDNCLIEEFLKLHNGGCIAAYASTGEASETANNLYCASMFNAIWPGFYSDYGVFPDTIQPVYRLGTINSQGKRDLHHSYSTIDQYALYDMVVFNLFGDPTLEMMTIQPTPFEDLSILRSSNGISVSLAEDATVSFFNQSTNQVVSYYGTNVVYNGNPNTVIVSVKKHNKIPYIEYPDTLYIQNQTIVGPRSYNAGHICVGSNVTNGEQSGPVFFNGGHVRLNGETVEIYGSTRINIGTHAEFNAE